MAHNYSGPNVTNATNPVNGVWFHGPIPNHNPGWQPTVIQNWVANGRAGSRPNIAVADHAHQYFPNPAEVVSKATVGVCMIDVGDNVMCGVVFENGQANAALRRHFRTAHPGAVQNATTQNVTNQEMLEAQNALKLFVRSGTWRDALFGSEPGRGPVGGLIDVYATEMEAIAAADATFAAAYGTRFHRDRLCQTRGIGKRKRGPSPPARNLKMTITLQL
ncbi:hypothetical protein NA57DRAFT_70473 [Rhizodiscina lignyota]|uniref:Uncharacterized protein n=1 Tax=Rhizodiscina lignyota TaxID=1504668 RepID=A0A9P4IRX5_9PEZI|nr:hypothetical protein NA57DRAFT_70473 [Rhizodiscina lignyota]